MPGGGKKKLSRKKVRNLSKSPHFTVIKKKSCGISMGLEAFKFPIQGVKTILWNSRDETLFCLEFPRVNKKTYKNSREVFKKVCPQLNPPIFFLSGIPSSGWGNLNSGATLNSHTFSMEETHWLVSITAMLQVVCDLDQSLKVSAPHSRNFLSDVPVFLTHVGIRQMPT